MVYIWDDSLKTGNEMIDDQHKQLIAAINGLLDVAETKVVEAFKKSLDFLNDYTIKHFFEEEQLQQKYNYPDYPNHKKLHEGFKETVREMYRTYIMKGINDELIGEIKSKIGGWLVSHIKVEDVKLAAYIRSKE
jgi:hemerythrin